MTKTWNIIELKRKPDTGLVTEIMYVLNLEYNGKTDRQAGVVEIEGDPNSDSFIPYENLTEENIIEWITDTLGTDQITEIINLLKLRIDKIVEEENNPEFLVGLPWEE